MPYHNSTAPAPAPALKPHTNWLLYSECPVAPSMIHQYKTNNNTTVHSLSQKISG